MASTMGLKAEWAMDICTADSEGRPCDFTKVETRTRAVRKVIEDQPLVIICSPPCTDWSTIINLNWDKMTPAEREERRRIAKEHLEVCVKLYRIQARSGRYFLHERPQSAASWHDDLMIELSNEVGGTRDER